MPPTVSISPAANLDGLSPRVLAALRNVGVLLASHDAKPGTSLPPDSDAPLVDLAPMTVQATTDPLTDPLSCDDLPPVPPGWVDPQPMMDDILFAALSRAQFGRILRGPRGSGKTSGINVAARRVRELGIKVSLFPSQAYDGYQKEDFVFTHTVEGGSSKFIYGPLALAIIYSHEHPDEQAWLVVEEANMARPGVWSYANTFLDGSGGKIWLPDGRQIGPTVGMLKAFLLFNPEYVGTRPMNEAIADRLGPTDCTYLPPYAEAQVISARTGLARATAHNLCLAATAVREQAPRHRFHLSPRTLFNMAERHLRGLSWPETLDRELLPRVGAIDSLAGEHRETIREIMLAHGLDSW